MAGSRGLFVRQIGAVGTTPLEARRAFAGLLEENSPGVPRSGILTYSSTTLVTGSASAIAYTLGALTAVVNRAAGEGVYPFAFTGTTSVTSSPAPGTNSRIDLVWIKQNDPEKGDPDNQVVMGVVVGTAAASPADPTADVPSGAMVVGRARIYAGTTSVTGAGATSAGNTNTLEQVWPYAALRGAPVPVRTTTERNALSATAGKSVRRLDLGGVTERANGTDWRATDTRHAELTTVVRTWGSSAEEGPYIFAADNTNSENNDFVTPGAADMITLTKPGSYMLQWLGLGATSSVVPAGSYVKFTNADGSTVYAEESVGAGTSWRFTSTTLVRVAPGAAPMSVRVVAKMGASWTGTTRMRVVAL